MPFTRHLKFCKQCGKVFRADGRRSKKCDKCKEHNWKNRKNVPYKQHRIVIKKELKKNDTV